MKLLLACLIIPILLTACGTPARPPAAASPAVSTQLAVVMPGDTHTAASSPAPASTAAPAATFTPTTPPAPAVIGLDNFSQLVQLHDYSADMVAALRQVNGMDNAQKLIYVISPDGTRLAVAVLITRSAMDPTQVVIILLDTLTGDQVSSFLLPPGNSNYNLVFTPDGQKLLYFIYPNSQIILWDIAAQKMDRVFWSQDSTIVWQLAVSPDGKLITAIVASDSSHGKGAELMVWDTGSGNLLRQAPADAENQSFLQFSADGQRLLVTTSITDLSVYDTTPWNKVSTIHTPGLYGPELAALSPDGAHVLTGNFAQGKIMVWDAGTGQPVQEIETPFAKLAFFGVSPDGSLLMASGTPPLSRVIDDSLYTNAAVFDTATWTQVGILPLGLNSGFQLSPDGKSLVVWQKNSRFSLVGLPDGKILAARQVAETFSAALSTGDYAAAAPLFHLYDGQRDALQSKGMTTDPAALLEAVCTQGAFPCLPGTVIYIASKSPEIDNRQSPPMYSFLVQYTNPDGSLYRDANGLSIFTFQVLQDTDGSYKVDLGMDLSYVLK